MKPSTVLTATAFTLALGVFSPLALAAGPQASPEVLKQLEILSRKVKELEQKLANQPAPAASAQELDQKVRIIDRKLELTEEALQKATGDVAKHKADADKKAKLLPTVYGKINIAAEQRNLEGAERLLAGNAAGAPTDRLGVESFASRFGIKGEVELGSPALKAVYLAEYEINTDDGGTGDSAFSQRNVYAGLKSSTFGTVIAGKIDTPFKTAEGKVDQFNDLRADIDNLAGGQNRSNDSIIYSTPKLGGIVTANVALIQAEGKDVDYDGHEDDDLGDSISASVVAESGIFYGAIAYDKDVSARRSADGFAKKYAEAYRLVATVKPGPFELGVLLQQDRDLTPGSDLKDNSYLLSGAVNLLDRKLKLKAQGGYSTGKINDNEGQLWAVGADWYFTPKTRAYTYWSTLDVDKANTGVKVNDDTLAVGFEHNF